MLGWSGGWSTYSNSKIVKRKQGFMAGLTRLGLQSIRVSNPFYFLTISELEYVDNPPNQPSIPGDARFVSALKKPPSRRLRQLYDALVKEYWF